MARKNHVILDFKSALRHLQEDQAALLPSALAALSGTNRKELGDFANVWVELPSERRRRAAQLLVELAEENFKHDFNMLFRYMLNDEDAAVRAHAIDGLWEDEDTALVKPLIGFLRSDPDPLVRAAAADSLGRFVLLAEYDRLPQAPLVDLVHDALLATIRSPIEATNVRARAIEALAYWSEDMMRDIIAAAYEDKDAQMRASAVSAMGRSADAYWRSTAAGELQSTDPRMRFEAVRTAGELENRAAVPRLIELIQDADREVQSAAITALGQIGGKPARDALKRAAESPDEVIRNLADEALQELAFASSSEMLLLDLAGERDEPDVLGDDDEDLDDLDDDLADSDEEESDETLDEEDWDIGETADEDLEDQDR